MIDLDVLNPLVSYVTGSVGYLTASRNRGGSYYRTRVTPANPATSAQVRARRDLRYVTRRWLTWLTPAARDRWDSYAAGLTAPGNTGQRLHITGFQRYVQLNAIRRAFGLYDHFYPPVIAAAAWHLPYLCTMTAPSSVVTVSWTGTQPFSGETYARLFAYNTVKHPSTIDSFKPPYLRRTAMIAGNPSPLSFGSAQVVNASDRVFVKLVLQRADGRLSDPYKQRVIVQ